MSTQPPPSNTTTTTNYTSLKCVELKELLKERSLPCSGNKAELIARLVEDDAGASERKKWSDCPPDKVFSNTKTFDQEKVGPKNCDMGLSPLGVFLLLWGAMLTPLAAAIDKKIGEMKVPKMCHKYVIILYTDSCTHRGRWCEKKA